MLLLRNFPVSSQVQATKNEQGIELETFVHAPVNFNPGSEYNSKARKYQGIPTIECTKSGRLWAAWYAGRVWEDQYNYVVAATSKDSGKTWSDIKFVIDPDGEGPMRASDPCLWLDPNGRLWLFWWLNGPGKLATVTMAITTDDPNDENPIWSTPRIICNGVMLNKPIETKNGEWMLPTAIWHTNNGCRLMVSTDKGHTWLLRGTANVPMSRRDCDEPMIAESRDGSTLIQLIRTKNYGIAKTVSTDGGYKWSAVKDYLFCATSRFTLRKLNSGNLLLVKHGSINLDKQIDRSHLTAFISKDDGETWQGGLLIDERIGVSYPDVTQTSDGRIYLIYDWNRRTDKNILLASFTEDNVLEGNTTNSSFRQLVNKSSGIYFTNPSDLQESDLKRAAPSIILQQPPADHPRLQNIGYNGVPSIATSLDGKTIYIAYYLGWVSPTPPYLPGGEGPGNCVTLSVSNDYGKSWKNNQLVICPEKDSVNRFFDPALWRDKNGQVWLFYSGSMNVKELVTNGGKSDNGIFAMPISCNNGKIVYKEPRLISYGVMLNKPVYIPQKDISLFPISIWSSKNDRGGTYLCRHSYSNEKKITPMLSHYAFLPFLNDSLRTCDEHCIVQTSDTGDMLCLLRTKKGIFYYKSDNYGNSWSIAAPFIAIGENPASRFNIMRLKSGSLILVLNNSTERTNLTAFISKDGGNTWPYKIVLDNRTDVSYPDIDQSEDGKIHVTYDRDRRGEKEINYCCFHEADVINGIADNISKIRINLK